MGRYDRSKATRGHQGPWWDKGKPAIPDKHTEDIGEISPMRMAIYYLAIWPQPIVSRATIKALLPGEGAVGSSIGRRARKNAGSRGNRVSYRLQRLYADLERDGLIQRGSEFIKILDQPHLLDRVMTQVYNPDDVFFAEALEYAASLVATEIHEEQRPKVRAIREQELAFIRSLMRNGSNRDSRRRLVRHEAGAITIPLGATTGERPKVQKPPVFPVIIKELPDKEPTYDFNEIYDSIYDYET